MEPHLEENIVQNTNFVPRDAKTVRLLVKTGRKTKKYRKKSVFDLTCRGSVSGSNPKRSLPGSPWVSPAF